MLKAWCKSLIIVMSRWDSPKKNSLTYVHITPSNLTLLYQINTAGLARKKKAGEWWPPTFFYPRQVVSYRWSKNNILASLCLASYLAANWMQKLKTKVFITQKLFHVSHTNTHIDTYSVCVCVWCVCVCVCVWYLSFPV